MKDSVATKTQSPVQVRREKSGGGSIPVLSQESIGLAEKLFARLPESGAVLVLGSLSEDTEPVLASQLARALQIVSSKRVVLIEACQGLGKTGTGVSLMEILEKNLSFSEALDEREPLNYLRFGNPPDDAIELIISDRFRELIEHARQRFPWVILQCWNLPDQKEAVTLVSRADGVMVACKAGRARTSAVQAIMDMCSQVKTEFLGVVLT